MKIIEKERKLINEICKRCNVVEVVDAPIFEREGIIYEAKSRRASSIKDICEFFGEKQIYLLDVGVVYRSDGPDEFFVRYSTKKEGETCLD